MAQSLRPVSILALLLVLAPAAVSGEPGPPPAGEGAPKPGGRRPGLTPEQQAWADRLLSRLDDERQAAIDELTAMGVRASPLVAGLFNSPAPEVRRAALDVAIAVRDPELIPDCTGALHDRDLSVRWQACRFLGVMGEHASGVAPDLLDAMLDPSRRVQHPATAAVAGLGSVAFDALIAHMGRTSPTLAARPFRKLLASGSAFPMHDCFVKALGHADEGVRSQAARVFRAVRPGDGAAVDALIRAALEDPAAGVRIEAAAALAEAPSEARERTVRGLREGLKDPEKPVRTAIAAALRALGENVEEPR
ncbi:MAG: HEAT repeat domain-containing protein [Candidatus Brocadiae bacterium]|nr:HEAT repeat domain-containing protein [Candidatus Brocadiia bacterium]